MGGKGKIPLETARAVAKLIIDELEPVCHRIEVAGSVRRNRPEVGDIEIVAEPVVVENPQKDLFGNSMGKIDRFDDYVNEMMVKGIVQPHPKDKKMGSKYKKLWRPQEQVQVDLFIVRPPASWGTIFAIRTGPAEFNHRIVTECKSRGIRVKSGHVERYIGGEWVEYPTPEEVDFFMALELPYLSPEERI